MGKVDQQGATILHVSDTLFGDSHRFTDDSIAGRLVADLRGLLADEVPGIDLIVHSGDIAERGMRSEYDHAKAFVDALCAATGLNHGRVVTVPGNHDVNWKMAQSYFDECEAEEIEPRPPYSRKWRQYQQFVTWLHGEAAFTEEQPYRLHRFDDLGLMLLAINSTMRDSHRSTDHYGWCGEEQLRWVVQRLRDARGLVRIGVLHHSAMGRTQDVTERLRDGPELTRLIGGDLELLLHGHSHDGAPERLADGDTLVLATGTAAEVNRWRPGEAATQFQILRVEKGHVTRWARRWDADRRAWVPDERAGAGPRGRDRIRFSPWSRLGRSRAEYPADRVDDFASQVEYVTSRRLGPECPVERRTTADGLAYLIAVPPSAPLRCVAIVDGPLRAEMLDLFDTSVFEPLRERGATELVLVHHGVQVPELCRVGRQRGVWVKTWTEYNDLLDASAYRTWLRNELDRDTLYPQALYLPQRYQNIDRWGRAAIDVRDNLVEKIYDRVLSEDGQFFLVLGEAGFGKSFLVRRLAHLILDTPRAGITPIVIYLRDRDKRQTIEEMVSNVLIASRSTFNADYFQHSLKAGTLALLIDGYDEFAVRVGYTNAAEQLKTFIDADQGRAKIVLTTRPNHFRSTDEATSALFASLRTLHHGSVYQLEPFNEGQQQAFLARWFEITNEAEAAKLASRWMEALAKVDNLPELARTPRMLSFMAQDLSLEQIEAAAGAGTVTAAALYQTLVDLWLSGEASKVNPLDERNVTAVQRQLLLEELALTLWRTNERDVSEAALQEVARNRLDLPRIEMTVDQAAQLIGGRTLLRVASGRWRFAHQSVWEFLLANGLARRLRAGTELARLGEAQLTQLTIRFLRDLSPDHAAAWAQRIADGNRG